MSEKIRGSPATRTAAGGVLLTAAVCLAGAYFGGNVIAGEGVQAALAELGSGRLGVAWSDPDAPPPSGRVVLGRALRGAMLAFGAAALVLGFATATRACAAITPALSIATLALALLDAMLLSARDELLLRGVVLRLLRGRAYPWALVACGAASAAWALGRAGASGTPIAALVVEALAGIAFATLWLRERGAWAAWGAHAAWALVTRGGTAAAGEVHTLFDVRPAAPSAWSGGDAGVLAGWSAACALALVCAGAIAWLHKRANVETSAPPPPVG